MPLLRVALSIALACWATTARADAIEPGLWKIKTWVYSAGVMSPPKETTKCLTPEQTRDLATTFSPVSRTINSECAPLESKLDGKKLTWKLACKGQLDMDVTGDFNFDEPHHYTAVVQTKASMAGLQMVDTRTLIEGEWLSECEQPPTQ